MHLLFLVFVGNFATGTDYTSPHASYGSQCKEPRVALCITGESRTLPRVVENLRFTHIDSIGHTCVDRFVVVDASEDHWKGIHRLQGTAGANYTRRVHEAIDILGPVARDVAYKKKWESLSSRQGGGECEQLYEPSEAFAQFEKNYRAWSLVRRHEIEGRSGSKYSWALRLRTDVPFAAALPPFNTWPPPPPPNEGGGGLVCSEAQYQRPGRYDDKNQLWPVFEDQWGLMTRHAADSYFLGPHLMQQRCWIDKGTSPFTDPAPCSLIGPPK